MVVILVYVASEFDPELELFEESELEFELELDPELLPEEYEPLSLLVALESDELSEPEEPLEDESPDPDPELDELLLSELAPSLEYFEEET